MNRKIHWVGMKADIKKYVEKCEICQRNKADSLSPASLLQPLLLPDLILRRLDHELHCRSIEGVRIRLHHGDCGPAKQVRPSSLLNILTQLNKLQRFLLKR